jgi:hypothetical protein
MEAPTRVGELVRADDPRILHLEEINGKVYNLLAAEPANVSQNVLISHLQRVICDGEATREGRIALADKLCEDLKYRIGRLCDMQDSRMKR